MPPVPDHLAYQELLAAMIKAGPSGICPTCGLGPSSPHGGSELPHRECVKHIEALAGLKPCEQCGYPDQIGSFTDGKCQRCMTGGLPANTGKPRYPIDWNLGIKASR